MGRRSSSDRARMEPSSTESRENVGRMADIILNYQADGDLFSGRILYVEAPKSICEALTFDKLPFATMIARLAAEVSFYLEADEKIGVVLRREDLPQAAPYRLDKDTIHLLRADPVTVIRSMRAAPTKVVVRAQDQAASSPFRIGYATLASSFGNSVYIRVRADEVECPCCGRWANLEKGVETKTSCRNLACQAKFKVTLRSDRWANVTVKELLSDTSRERYFLPREWNTNGPWITREALEQKRKDWMQTKKELINDYA